MRQTGHPHGWPGHVVDHRIPLACGGADALSNMQWQTIEEAKAKDKVERQGCGGPTSERPDSGGAGEPSAAGGGPVIPPTKAVKIAVAVICVALAGVHVAVPALPIDATFLGLFTVAVIVLVFDVESIDALSIRARLKQIAKAERAVAAVAPSAEPVAPALPPAVAVEANGTIAIREEARAELQPVALTPPVDPGERLSGPRSRSASSSSSSPGTVDTSRTAARGTSTTPY